MLRKKRTVKIRRLFIRYLSLFCFGTLALIAIIFVSFGLLINLGVILPANYAEKQLIAAKETIAASEVFTPDMVPDSCRYSLFSVDGKVISGNFTVEEAKKVWEKTQNIDFYQNYPKNYLKIQRKNEVCIVSYIIQAEFSSQYLKKHLPNVEILPIIVFIAAFIIGVFILASLFGKKLYLKMSSLQDAAEKIQNQNLDFIIEATGVYEIDKVLYSMEEMKEALKLSLNKQWNMENTRKEQIAALAHDLKTPLTIIRGNAELLAETEQTKEQKEYTDYLQENVHQMECYIKTLIEISKDEIISFLSKEKLETSKYMENIYNRVNALSNVKKLKLNFNTSKLPLYFYADSEKLLRAVMNIVSNAVEYSPENSTISFYAIEAKGYISFTVTDSGKGFTGEALKLATQQFYTANQGRTSVNHYGLGLYITKTIAELHGGSIEIDNSENCGGQVTLKIPVCDNSNSMQDVLNV